MKDTKYEILSSDEETAVTSVKALPIKKNNNTTKNPYPFWKKLLKFLLILALAVVIVFSFLGMAAYHFGHHVMHKVGEVVIPQITTEHPMVLPKVHMSKHEIHDIKERLHSFHHELHHDRTPKHDLVLTEQEINGLICDDHKMCGHAHATISNNMIAADFSIPAENAPGGKGRYFVGKKNLLAVPDDKKESFFSMQHTLTMRGANHEDFTVLNATGTMDLLNVDVEVQSAELFGWMATDAFVQRFFQGKNWAEHMCPHAKKAVDHIEGVSIGNGKIVVHVK